MKSEFLIICAIVVVTSTADASARVPWKRRIGEAVECIHLTAHKETPVALWPTEPIRPTRVELPVFTRALGQLCTEVPPQRIEHYADLILTESSRFGVDPFELAALMYDGSRCWPATPKRDQRFGRYGLTRFPLAMHARQMRDGAYVYFVRSSQGDWQERSVPLERFKLNRSTLLKPESNLYFTAAVLKILHEQDRDLDEAFTGSVPHRHAVSHWFYGDRVREAEPENRVLRARRRLIAYYLGEGLTLLGNFQGVPIVAPLDGSPRFLIDYFGNKRGKKESLGHRGIDLDGHSGEQVRAIAAGRVTFAGVDLDGASSHQQLTPKEAAEWTNDQMGPGGLYVHIRHDNGFGTVYMHLESIAVEYWQEVEAGQIIGTLGRSGTETSGPHLHLEFRVGTDRVDPAVPLKESVIDRFSR